MNPVGRWFAAQWARRHPASDVLALTQRNLYIVPTRAGLGYLAMLLLLLVATINEQLSLGYALTFLLAGAGLASLWATHRNLHGLQLHLLAPPPVHAGDEVRLRVALHNTGPARWAVAIHPRGRPAADAGWADVPARAHAELQLSLPMPQRGRHALPPLRVESRFPLGLFVCWAVWRPAAQVWVYPRPEHPAPALPREGEAGPPPASATAQAPVHSEEMDELRPYRLGDPLAQVLWKQAARQPDAPLWVRARSSTGHATCWLNWQATQGLDSEARLARLAAWVLSADLAGLRFGLHLPGLTLPPARGETQRHAALRALAGWGLQSP